MKHAIWPIITCATLLTGMEQLTTLSEQTELSTLAALFLDSENRDINKQITSFLSLPAVFTKHLLSLPKSIDQNIEDLNDPVLKSFAVRPEDNAMAFMTEKGKLFLRKENGKLFKLRDDCRTFRFRPNSRQYAFINKSRTLFIYEENQEEEPVLILKKPHIFLFAFSQDGLFLAIKDNEECVSVFNLEQSTERSLGFLPGTFELIFSPNGRYLLGVQYQNALLWDLNDDNAAFQEVKRSGAIAFDPTSSYLVMSVISQSPTDDIPRLEVKKVDDTDKTTAFIETTKSVQHITFTPDGRYLLSCDSDNKLSFWPFYRVKQTNYIDKSMRVTTYSPWAALPRWPILSIKSLLCLPPNLRVYIVRSDSIKYFDLFGFITIDRCLNQYKLHFKHWFLLHCLSWLFASKQGKWPEISPQFNLKFPHAVFKTFPLSLQNKIRELFQVPAP